MGILLKSHSEFKQFFNEFFPAVYALMLKYTKDTDVARDLSQEVFVKAYENREIFETVENARAFLYTIARHLFLNHHKREKIKIQTYSSFLDTKEPWEESWLDQVTVIETTRLLHSAIKKLAPQTRKIIQLNLEGKNNNEVAEELGISINTVKSLKKKAYVILRKSLSKEYIEPLFFFLHLFS